MNTFVYHFYRCLTGPALLPSVRPADNAAALACSWDATWLMGLLFGLAFGWLLWWQVPRLRLQAFFTYAYLARYPVLILALVVGLPYLAVGVATNTLKNLFILRHWWELAIVTWLALLLAWTPFFGLRILAHAATKRFTALPALQCPVGRLNWCFTRSGFYALAAIPLMLTLYLFSEDVARGLRLVGIGVGWAAALGCGWLQRWLLQKSGARVAAWFMQLGQRAMQAVSWLAIRLQQFAHWVRQRLPARLQAWLAQRAASATPRADGGAFSGYAFALGHGSAIFFFAITLGVYLGAAWLFVPDHLWFGFEPPALGYLLLLLMLLGWVLPGMAFFLDRYRFPVLLVIAGLSLFAWSIGDADYFYPIQPVTRPPTSSTSIPASGPGNPLVTADVALHNWHTRHQTDTLPIVIVATSGGGIKAAVWTTVVLQALQAELGQDFASHIVLISSVSGGSVGALHYLDAWQSTGPPASTTLTRTVDAAAAPSLASATWGLVYPDLWRTLIPLPGGRWNHIHDRGWAMEEAWMRHLAHPDATLADWRREVYTGTRPASLFNATIVENGGLFVLTPLDNLRVNQKCTKSLAENRTGVIAGEDAWQSLYFSSIYPSYTLRAATAARLSATFPYVSPITRPRDEASNVAVHPGCHLADGGYFDNYGIVAALEWLEAVKTNVANQHRNVLLIQIEAGIYQQEYLSDAKEDAGWLYSMAGPLIGVMNTQFTAQKWRNTQAVDWLDRLYRDIQIEPVPFVYRGEASLSWQLSQTEVASLRAAVRNHPGLRDACHFFYRNAGAAERCAALAAK